jgi:hypothetical protein
MYTGDQETPMTKRSNEVETVDDAPVESAPVPVPQAAWEPLERMQLAVQVSQQKLQVFVDGLALGQGVAQGAQLTQLPQGGWAWVVKE